MTKPIAWIHTDPDKPRVKFLEWREDEPGYRGRWIKTPLFTTPPGSLSPEECIDILLKRMNISELARAIGVDASAISHAVAGRSRITHYEKVDKLRSMV